MATLAKFATLDEFNRGAQVHSISRRAFAGTVASGIFLVESSVMMGAEADTALSAAFGGLSRLLGHWRGEGDGQPGHSTVERRYEPALGGHFILVHNQSTYLPQPKNPKGEVHNDVGFFSFDKARKRAVLRQFHVEGFVNQYAATSEALDTDTFVFESEAIENIPAGWRARETYRLKGEGTFEEVFELAEPDKDFEVYSHARFVRS